MFMTSDATLLDGVTFAKLVTLMPDGAPQNTVMWFRSTGDTLRMIAPASSRKARNLQCDSRVAIVIDDPGNGYRYLEIRGRAELVADDDAAREELRHIATRYIGDSADDYVDSLSADPRVLIVIHPESVRRHHGNPPGASS